MRRIALVFSATAFVLSAGASTVMAQSAPPTYQADPDVFKVIFEDQNFRVIAATWKKGARDKVHSHPVPSVVYSLTDCRLRIYEADGKTREIDDKAGKAQAAPVTPSHSTENVGPDECRVVFVEHK